MRETLSVFLPHPLLSGGGFIMPHPFAEKYSEAMNLCWKSEHAIFKRCPHAFPFHFAPYLAGHCKMNIDYDIDDN